MDSVSDFHFKGFQEVDVCLFSASNHVNSAVSMYLESGNALFKGGTPRDCWVEGHDFWPADFIPRKIGYELCHPVDGSEIRRSPVDMVNIPLFTTGFSTIQTVVGNGISEASTVCFWDGPIYLHLFRKTISYGKKTA